MACSAVLFDLDGTLADTYDLILASQRYATRTVLGRVIPDERLMATVGIPLADQMADYTDDPAVVDELCRVYREHNALVHDELIKGFPGIHEALDAIVSLGAKTGIVTSKRKDAAVKVLESLDLTRFSGCLVGGTDPPLHKPHPDPVLRGCELLGVEPSQCVYVGDSPFDIQAGNSAGCKTIAVTWGVFTQGRLAECSPSFFACEPSQLPELIASL